MKRLQTKLCQNMQCLKFKQNMFFFFFMLQLSAQQNHAAFDREISEILKQIQYNKFYNSKLWRELRYLSVVGAAALPIDDYERVCQKFSFSTPHPSHPPKLSNSVNVINFNIL